MPPRKPTSPKPAPSTSQSRKRSVFIFNTEIAVTDLLMVLFTAVLAIVAYRQFAVTQGQLDVMKGQLDEMKAEQRPWLSLKAVLTENVSVFDKGVSTSLKVTVKNTGNRPAIGVEIYPAIFPFGYKVRGYDLINAAVIYKVICGTGISVTGLGASVFPGDSFPAPDDGDVGNYTASLSPMVEAPDPWPSTDGTHYFAGHLAVCVAYTSSERKDIYRGVVVYEIIKPKKEAPAMLLREGSFSD